MAGLSRDILKWLQSLDLSHSVKNVRRDFANGFLVAEIFSRYFPHEIQMHSFDNGLGLPRKLGNWSLLEKFFEKKRVPISRILIDNVIHCKGEAAIPLMETIYTCLTSKKVYSVRPTNDDELIPPFARNTASVVIKENIRDSELATTLQDDDTTRNRTAALLQAHENTLRNERVSEPVCGQSVRRLPDHGMADHLRVVPGLPFVRGTAPIDKDGGREKATGAGILGSTRGGGDGALDGIVRRGDWVPALRCSQYPSSPQGGGAPIRNILIDKGGVNVEGQAGCFICQV
ncbi:hypothetical protein T484DRAFT_1926572 [Baffinella frigidus]|nr:hypothetical protein T484DRAFT_1926572 [Cryptophyta sp. CCMP2293]